MESSNPDALHDYYVAKNGPKNVPERIIPTAMGETIPNNNDNNTGPSTTSTSTDKNKEQEKKDPGHPYANTENISFSFYDQRESNAPFGYEYYVSLPPAYNTNTNNTEPTNTGTDTETGTGTGETPDLKTEAETGRKAEKRKGKGNKWPLILFLHGAGESQRRPEESYLSIRHGIPKINYPALR